MASLQVIIKKSPKHRRMIVESGVPEAQIQNRTDLIATGEDRGSKPRLKAKSAHPLLYYHKHNILSDDHVKAGMKLEKAFNAMNLSAIRAIMLDGTNKAGFTDHLTERQADAWKAYMQALEAIPGWIGKLMVRNVCCYGEWISDGKYKNYTNRNQAMARFKEAMDELVEYYS